MLIVQAFGQRLSDGRKLKFCWREAKLVVVCKDPDLITSIIELSDNLTLQEEGYRELATFLALGLACQRNFDEYWQTFPIPAAKKNMYHLVKVAQGWQVENIKDL